MNSFPNFFRKRVIVTNQYLFQQRNKKNYAAFKFYQECMMNKILANNSAAEKLSKSIKTSLMILAVVLIIGSAIFTAVAAQDDHATEAIAKVPLSTEQAEVSKMAVLAAAIAFGAGAIAAGIGISHVGAAAIGAVAEKPEIAGQALIFIALAEGLVVFGFITALMILGKM
jgi:V/A-type H+-transporting ATPase subunit K